MGCGIGLMYMGWSEDMRGRGEIDRLLVVGE